MFRRFTAVARTCTLAAALALGVTAIPAASAAPAVSPAAPTADRGPATAVEEHLRGKAHSAMRSGTETEPRVSVKRQAGGWAFGTAVLATAPGSSELPQGWLFVAHRENGAWKVALEGEAAFTGLSTRAEPVLRAAERRAFAATGETGTAEGGMTTQLANGDYRTGMALPFAVGQTWYMTSGPHGWSGSNTPWSSLDFAGGDQIVRAPRGGTAYTMCKGWIRIVHDRGYATDYYHLVNNISVDGAAVAAGAYLGYTGNDVTCGGSSSGRHVHFALRQNGNYIGIAGHDFGRWRPENGGAAYSGSALHGSRRVAAGGQLYNYGALGFTQGIIDTNGSGTTLNKRSGPGTGYAVVGTVADGVTVTVSCSGNGTTHTGRYGSTALWNRLSDGTWVSDAYMWTGVNGPVNGYC
ncbi:peptidoglycan DD-metalloendopeptidase family protein [Streptomyces thermolilacinus]|uniref:Peptidase M23 n=1 Tax=Streptomyces thermolilacinus SPC6 TaxID=1306406 RepID=A0A1D3DVW2_9ACTN|nr:peptidoglycan DD-metalloendopeptidase family protein [Streptomyces thermolilacinus]OEJ96458.1 peptidase M23 [Streptomyces thermolilacinus SPC6]